MKKALLIFFCLAFFSIFAQVPQAIKYQAIARSANGTILLNQNINLRISILSDSNNGASIYAEIHNVTTNAYGLINLEIGRGTAVNGTFAGIDWSRGIYFVKMEVDENGGLNFSLLGISQLVSVPFALYANSSGIPKMTNAQRDAMVNPAEGILLYNLNSECLNYRGSNKWLQVCGECVPLPSVPQAGSDSLVTSSGVQLWANNPQSGTGTWIVDSGTNGTFANIHDPHSMFYGENNSTYILSWQIATPCDTLDDQVTISFDYEIAITSLYILGDATSAGWDTLNPIQMLSWTANRFDQYLDLTPSQNGFKFIMTSGTWAVNWGTSMTTAINLNQDYDMVLHGNKIMVLDSGKYHVEVNFLTNKFKVTTFYAPDNLFLVGGSTPIGWDPSQAAQFSQISMGVFQIYMPMTITGDGYKFLPTMGTWADDWGQDPANPGHIIQNGEVNCPVNTDGFYLVNVDYRSMTFWATPVQWGVVGSGASGNWTSDVNMTYLGGTEPYSFELQNFNFSDGAMKFRANDAWDINLGDSNMDGLLDLYGDAIPVTAGNFSLKLMLEPNNWHFLFTPGIPDTADACDGISTLTYSGRLYHTVAIGNQCWMKENLNIGTMLILGNGIPIQNVQTNNSLIEKYCWLDDTANCSVYGGLYQWNEMMQYVSTPSAQGICPTGFHIPTEPEWLILLDTLGGGSVAGGKLKETGLDHWTSPNTAATNESGFTALGGGCTTPSYEWAYFKWRGYWWSSSEYDSNSAWGRQMTANSATNFIGSYGNTWGFSVRCIKD